MMMTLTHLVHSVPALLALSASALDAQQDSIIPPQLMNASEVSRTLDEAYPAMLRSAGIGGRTLMRMFINAEGASDTIRLAESTGLSGLDQAAWTTAKAARFRAGTLHGESIAAWVGLTVRFDGSSDAHNGPVTIPMTRRDEMTAALQSFYPADLRKALIGTSVGLSLLVDDAGSVVDHDVVDPSCFGTANDAASSFIRTLAFDSAAQSGPDPRHTFATVTFSADTARLLLFGDTVRRDTAASSTRREGATSRAPRLSNRPNVQRALVAHYPPLLRKRGAGGTANVHFRVETNGRVTYRSIVGGSGYCELDVAALNVAEVMRFDPALLDGERVPVWVQVPIVFSAR